MDLSGNFAFFASLKILSEKKGRTVMFNNIGAKIKTAAKVLCWIGIVACVIIGIVMMVASKQTVLTGLLVMIVGSLASWISSFMMVGFGQLVENSNVIAANTATRGGNPQSSSENDRDNVDYGGMCH